MPLVPQRPVTIERVRYGERWFPFVFRAADGAMVMYISYGHDTHWAPMLRLQSIDDGRTWTNPTDNTPRVAWAHWFDNGELLEIDNYGVHDPSTPATAVHYAALGSPLKPGQPVERFRARVDAPSMAKTPLNALKGYPTFHWWDLWNSLHATEALSGDEVHLNGPNFTAGIALPDGRLLAMGYWRHHDPKVAKDCTVALESTDRGRTWREVGMVTDLAATEPRTNEAALIRLRDGRLYAVLRTEGPLVHSWSSDDGRTWTRPVTMSLVDEPTHTPAHVWPVLNQLPDGTLLLVYGRPGKHMVVDPSGTGEQWQARLDLHAWELDTQALHDVPEDQRLRGVVGHDINVYCNRHTDSSDYLAVVPIGPDTCLVFYDVQHYIEHADALPVSAVRMVRVTWRR